MEKFELEVKDTQAKYKYIENTVNQQSSYNLPRDFFNYILDNNIIIEYSKEENDNKHYKLTNNYKLKLSSSLKSLINIDNDENEFICMEASSNGKPQLKRGDYHRKSIEASEYKWFVKLYDSNIAHNTVIFMVDEDNEELIIDVKAPNSEKSPLEIDLPSGEELGIMSKNDIDKPHNRIIYGAPGTGKSYKLNEEVKEFNTISRVTFYDGYTHGQFVGTYKPIPSGEGVSYEYVAGPFIKQLIEAIRNPNDNYCLVIEEINRARADKVFGNIFQLLDRDSSGKSQYPIELSEDQLNYFTENLESEYPEELKEIIEKGLYIPFNLYIWSTMNNADQGVYPLDSAFRRRWNFEHIGLDENEDEFKDDNDENKKLSILYEVKNDNEYIHKAIEWNNFRKVINEALLDEGIQEDRLIAPFFINPKQFIQDTQGGKITYIPNVHELKPSIYIDKVIMYLFEDVLRHKKKCILFNNSYKSFSQLKKDYKEKIKNDEEFSIFNDEVRDELRKFKVQEPEVVEEEAE